MGVNFGSYRFALGVNGRYNQLTLEVFTDNYY